jgi:tellurium resistance protein TerZ
MKSNDPGMVREKPYADAPPEPKDVVMGLHWDPPAEGATAHPRNLDAVCILLDSGQQVVDIIHPDHPRNANGSVVHTGDARTGASEWDDERIFVFLEALPANVSTLVFIVASATGHTFSEVRGASCHVSDHNSEYPWVSIELTSLGAQTTHCVATLCHTPTGWAVSGSASTISNARLAELLEQAACLKQQDV